MAGKITVPELRARKATAGRGEKIAMVTAYDATFARMLDAAGVDAMLVGDSLGMVIQGGRAPSPSPSTRSSTTAAPSSAGRSGPTSSATCPS